MSSVHPSPEVLPEVVEKIVARRGHLHAFAEINPVRTALIVIDLDVGSCAREPALTAEAITRINAVAASLRPAGGTVAFVTSVVSGGTQLSRRLGDQLAATYAEETRAGGPGTIVAPELTRSANDVRAVKSGASAFFPGKCDLHEQLVSRGIQSLLIAGLVTNVCCESSARDAVELGYEVTMVSDANVGHSYGLREASLTSFYRYFGDVRPSADVISLIESASASVR